MLGWCIRCRGWGERGRSGRLHVRGRRDRAGLEEVQTALREVRFSGWLAPPEAGWVVAVAASGAGTVASGRRGVVGWAEWLASRLAGPVLALRSSPTGSCCSRSGRRRGGRPLRQRPVVRPGRRHPARAARRRARRRLRRRLRAPDSQTTWPSCWRGARPGQRHRVGAASPVCGACPGLPSWLGPSRRAQGTSHTGLGAAEMPGSVDARRLLGGCAAASSSRPASAGQRPPHHRRPRAAAASTPRRVSQLLRRRRRQDATGGVVGESTGYKPRYRPTPPPSRTPPDAAGIHRQLGDTPGCSDRPPDATRSCAGTPRRPRRRSPRRAESGEGSASVRRHSLVHRLVHTLPGELVTAARVGSSRRCSRPRSASRCRDSRDTGCVEAAVEPGPGRRRGIAVGLGDDHRRSRRHIPDPADRVEAVGQLAQSGADGPRCRQRAAPWTGL
jgi:hypothetical protein